MEYASTAWHVISATLVLLAGALVAVSTGRKFGTRPKWALLLYAWHTIFCIVYAKLVMETGGDAADYFEASLLPSPEFAIGTRAVSYFTHIFSQYLGMSYLGVFLVFNIFGTIGLLAFDAVLRTVTAGRSRFLRGLAMVIVLLPSVSFWTAAIGKDSVAFMATSLAMWASMSMPRRSWLMIIAITCMFLMRPHIAAVMILSLAAAMVISAKMSWKWRVALVSVAMVATAAIVPFTMQYAGLGEAKDAATIEAYVETRQGYNQQGGGGIDIASMSLPMQLFTYVFRPLPYEANGIFGLAASLDNVVLLVLAMLGIWGMIHRRGSRVVLKNQAFLWIYCIGAWLILAPMTANLGISVRQKWMFVPMLVCLLICSIRERQVRRRAPATAYGPRISSR
ncbi:hypothetical protein [Cupriavidus consociatus]|uniref:hypothetical protein n=1 Tax=Cupriavidus consociatus TaxID=2821357 RepID=UPI001AE4FF68|nr:MULTISPECIES: hypothetical protein [unclassified Cupriavidus]MBP0623535.1 hypothetical protein [Cupriavidus sp. LEh25]MDK2660236.1 hypothetical protein [Cupriavidus sp. LEh21]